MYIILINYINSPKKMFLKYLHLHREYYHSIQSLLHNYVLFNTQQRIFLDPRQKDLLYIQNLHHLHLSQARYDYLLQLFHFKFLSHFNQSLEPLEHRFGEILRVLLKLEILINFFTFLFLNFFFQFFYFQFFFYFFTK